MALVAELGPGDGDDVGGPALAVRGPSVVAEGMGPQAGVIMSLEDQVDVMLVEDGDQEGAGGGALAVWVRRVDGVLEDDEFPGGVGPPERRVEPLGLLA